MDNKNKLDCVDHIVVLMLENRSFDNLLGYLYEDGVPKGKKFEGLQDGPRTLPVPKRAIDYNQHPTVTTQPATDYHQPYPDPGEVYQHVNTQLFNRLDNDNIGVDAPKMKPPYNLPNPVPYPAPMDGFVNDYINTLQALGGEFNTPRYEQYQVIMQCFKPAQVSVLSTLAKEFAVFDHWFCSVPSQTWCNRAFWHAATSCGEVINPPDTGDIEAQIEALLRWDDEFNQTPNLFGRMNDRKISWSIYQEDGISLTRFVNGFCNPVFTDDKFKNGLSAFQDDIRNKTLSQYSFIEPNFIFQHNDQHPSSYGSILYGETHPGSVLLGEKLIWDVYNAIRTSDTYRDNTLLIITHDEHGGCFDHVSPTKATPPQKGMVGDKGFTFDRLGVRVPMVMVSAYIAPNTIINDVHDHTSFIKTCCEKWQLQGLTDRDCHAKPFSSVFTDQRRELREIPEPLFPALDIELHKKSPLNNLQKGLLFAASFHTAEKTNLISEFQDVEGMSTVADAMAHLEKLSQRSVLCPKAFCSRLGFMKPVCVLLFNLLKKLIKWLLGLFRSEPK